MTPNPLIPVALYSDGAVDAEQIHYWRTRLKLPQVAQRDDAAVCVEITPCIAHPGFELSLSSTSTNLSLKSRLDFGQGRIGYRVAHAEQNHLLARAVGLSGTTRRRVLDMTGGLGRDAYILASLGCELTVIERHPLIFALLENALQRACTTPVGARIAAHLHLRLGDSIEYLKSLGDTINFDVIYLDPMYPETSSTALVKKEMQLLRTLLPAEPNQTEKLLQAASASRVRRIVLKRPLHAPSLFTPVGTIKARSTRYDLYTGKV